jgi:hypothetical protein
MADEPAPTVDPKSACCGDPGDCGKRDSYCFHRTPSYAVYTDAQADE